MLAMRRELTGERVLLDLRSIITIHNGAHGRWPSTDNVCGFVGR